METDNQLYILVLYERIGNSEPIHRGFKSISKEMYISLTDYKRTQIEIKNQYWGILERLSFKTPILDTMYYYVSVICQKN